MVFAREEEHKHNQAHLGFGRHDGRAWPRRPLRFPPIHPRFVMMASAEDTGTTENSKSESGFRQRLPVTQPDRNNVNLWSYLKQCIGKELTKITMPVQWNEPTSLLQRLAEQTHYARLLAEAATKTSPEERLLSVAAFAVSSLAANADRLGKPFNPLLGETYELDHGDFRIVCEQVGHHPPVSAFHVDTKEGHFVFHGSMYPKVKFWGKSVEFQPKGVLTVELNKFNEVYTWTNVNCVIHNIIVGTLWMEQQGTMEIVNHATRHRCVLTFKPSGWFSNQNDLNTVEGFLVDGSKRKLFFVYGRWSDFLCAVDIESLEKHLNASVEKVDAGAAGLPKHAPFELGAVPNSRVLWRADPRPKDADQYYNFSAFTMRLNEMTSPSMEKQLCPTDCRLRPDIRALENGQLDSAASEKERLENKQREYRKPFKTKREHEWWSPRWFLNVKNEHTQESDWKYVGGFWERKFDKVPNIF